MDICMDDDLKIDFFNYCAIQMLEALGNSDPTQTEIDAMEIALKTTFKDAIVLLREKLL